MLSRMLVFELVLCCSTCFWGAFSWQQVAIPTLLIIEIRASGSGSRSDVERHRDQERKVAHAGEEIFISATICMS